MSVEHKRIYRRVESGSKALLTGFLLYLGPQAPSVINSLLVALSPSHAIAAELQKPQEQTSDLEKQLARFTTAIEHGDVKTATEFLSETIPVKFVSPPSNNSAFGTRRENFTKPQVLAMFEKYKSRSPVCRGVKEQDGKLILIVEEWPLITYTISEVTLELDSQGNLLMTQIAGIVKQNQNAVLSDPKIETCSRDKPSRGSAYTQPVRPSEKQEPVKPIAISSPAANTPGAISKSLDQYSMTPDHAKELPKEIMNLNIVYTAVNGKEEPKIYSMTLEDFKPVEKAKVQGASKVFFSPDGKSLIFEREYEVFSLDLATGREEKLISKKIGGGDSYLVECPRIDQKTGRVYVTLTFGANDQNIYSFEKDGSKEQITQDSKRMSEACGLISPDGQYLAFSRDIPGSHNSNNQGLVLTKYEGGTKDISNEPIFIQGSVMPLEWSFDGKELLVLLENNKTGTTPSGSLIIINAETKKREQAGVNRVTGGSFSPDGRFILYARNEGARHEFWVYSRDKNKHYKIGESGDPVWYPTWEKKISEVSKEPEVIKPKYQSVIFAPGITTEVVGGRVSNFTGNTLDRLRVELIKRGYTEKGIDIITRSSAGGKFNEQGEYEPFSATCDLSLTHAEKRARAEVEFIQEFQRIHPDRKMVYVTHSDGGVMFYEALKIIKNEGIKVDLSKIEIISTHIPFAGVNHPVLTKIAEFWPFTMAGDCLTTNTSFPSIKIFDTEEGRYLGWRWNNRTQVRSEAAKVLDWAIEQGLEITNILSEEDSAIDPARAPLSEWERILEIIMYPKDMEDMEIYSAWLPGEKVINIVRRYGRKYTLGHGDILMGDAGIQEVIGRIGDKLIVINR